MKQVILFLFTILTMCVAGFWQSEAGSFTPAHWSDADQGLYFNGNSFAYTEQFFPVDGENTPFTLKMVFKPERYHTARFNVILDIHDLHSENRIVVGQWNQSLVVLQSDDYSNRKRLPKIYVPLEQTPDPIRLTVASGRLGTRVYINDTLLGSNRKLKLALPTHAASTHLMLGNDIRGKTPWRGSIRSLAIYTQTKQYAALGDPSLEYIFSPPVEERVEDTSATGIPLLLPRQATILQKQILEFPRLHNFYSGWIWRDMLINFFGFVPFGLLLSNLLRQHQTRDNRWLLCMTTGCAFLFSLTIEITQVMMPLRNSSLLDLILNTAGGGCGAALAVLYHRLRPGQVVSSTTAN